MQKDIPICDLHCDTASLLLGGADLNDPSMQVNLPAMRAGGIGLQVFACYLPPSIPKGQRFGLTCSLIDRLTEEIGRHAEEIAICCNAREVAAAQTGGKIAALIAVENGNAIDGDLQNLQRFYDRGVRLMTIIHAQSNEWAISSNDNNPAFAGLSDFGREVITTMNELGMIIDLSHSHDVTAGRVLELSRHPVVASHSCAKALCPADRNLNDELLAGLAENGGLVGLNLYPGFLDGNYYRLSSERAGDLFSELNRMEKEAGVDLARIAQMYLPFCDRYASAMADSPLPLERYFDHILYISELIGSEHIAFGSDFDGIPVLPENVRDCSVFATIRDQLLQRDYSAEEVRAICWENFMRILSGVCG